MSKGNSRILGGVVLGQLSCDVAILSPPLMEHQVEKNMEHEMDTGGIYGWVGFMFEVWGLGVSVWGKGFLQGRVCWHMRVYMFQGNSIG